MEDAQILEAIGNGLKPFETAFDAKLDAKLAEIKPAENVVELESSMAKSLTKMEIWDIPVGQAVAGGFVAILATELVDGFMASQTKMTRGLVKAIGAGAVVKWGKKIPLIGDVAPAIALLLAFDAARDILPIDEWARSASTAISGVIPMGGLAGLSAGQRHQLQVRKELVMESPDVYADLYGGR